MNRIPQIYLCIAWVLLALLLATVSSAVNPLPTYGRYPCSPATQGCRLTVPALQAIQIKRADRGIGPPVCTPDSQGFCSTCGGGIDMHCTTPSVDATTYRMISGTRQLEFDIAYNFPNAYCQAENPPETWPVTFENTLLRLYSTDSMGGNRVLVFLSDTPTVFENGRWLPQITLPTCSLDAYYQAELVSCSYPPLTFITVTSPVFHVTVTADDCAAVKPTCSAGTSVGPGGVPIGLQSAGSTRTTAAPTREEAPVPGPLGPHLFYNGNTANSGGAGPSWFMTYGDTLTSAGTGQVAWAGADGSRTSFSGSDASGYDASDPGDARGHVALISGEYVLTTPDGLTRTFLTGSNGFWKKTVDRWGSGALGNPTSTSRATVVQELIGSVPSGRQISLAYDSGGRLTSVTDVNNGLATFGYDVSGRLETICTADQTCPLPQMAVPWRRFAYDGSSTRLVTIKDRTDSFIRGWDYFSVGGVQHTWIGTSAYAALGAQERTEYTVSGAVITVKRKKPDESTVDTAYTVAARGGVWRVTGISGACPECGDENSSRTFDPVTGRLLTRTNGNGYLTTFGYDADGNPTQVVEASGTSLARTTTYVYAVPGTDVVPSVWPLTTKDFWKSKTQPSGVKPGSNAVTTRSWAGSGNLELSETTNGFLSSTGSAVPRTTKTTYDSSGRVLSVDGPRLSPVIDVTTFAYYPPSEPNLNNRYRLQQTTGPDGTITKFEYNALGGLLKLTRDKGTGTADAVTEYAYDAVGRRITETLKATPTTSEVDLVTSYGYDVAGRLSSTEIREGMTSLTKTVFGLELGTGRVLTRTNPDNRFGSTSGERASYTYDDRGNVTRETSGYFNGVGTTTEYDVTRVYDGLCRVKKQTFPADSATTRFDYDCAGNLMGISDADHYMSDATLPNLKYVYDALNRLTKATRTAPPANGGDDISNYGYDLRDQLTSVTDPNGAVTTYVVDDFGALRQQFTPLAGGGVADETDYGYDEANDLTSTTETGIRATNRAYDAAGRLTTITYVSGGPPGTVTYTYDTVCMPDPLTTKTFGQGRLCKVTDGTATTEYAYDRRGLIVKERVTLVATPGTKVYDLTYQYDAAGRRKSVAYPSGDVVIGSFDLNNRPQDLTYTPFGGSSSPLVTKIAHQVNGPIRSFRTSSNLQEARTFDTRFRRLTQRTFNLSTNPMTLLASWQFGDGRVSSTAYDKESNLLAFNDVTPGISPPSNRIFGYDPDRYFLTSSTGPYGAGFASQALSWMYDNNGNRKTEVRGGVTTTYAYENAEASPPFHSNGVIASLTPGGTVNHLNSGDLSLDEQLIQHSYDALGRLIESNSTSGCATFPARNVLKRDAAGHRVVREVYPCNSSTLSKTEYFVYGSDGNLHYREVFNAGSSVPNEREAYVYLEGEPVAILRTIGSPTGNLFLHNDHLGRPLAMTGSDGFLWWKGEFEPFGKTLAPRTKTTTLEPAFRFPGQWENPDSENVTLTGSTGILGKINALEDNWNRTYATRWGRYTQPDPIRPALPEMSLLSYPYAGDSPIRFIDPDGLYRVDPGFPSGCRPALDQAISIVQNAFNRIPGCSDCPPSAIGRTYKSLLDDPNLVIGYVGRSRVSPCAYGETPWYLDPRTGQFTAVPNPRVTGFACRMGRWMLARAIVHELTHVGGVAFEAPAYAREARCGFPPLNPAGYGCPP